MMMCVLIHGHKHCFHVPELVDMGTFHIPTPPNYPELELAATILELVDRMRPVRDTEFTKALSETAIRYIEQVQKGLPAGVEIVHLKAKEKTA